MAQPQLSLPPLAPHLRARLPLSLPSLAQPSLPLPRQTHHSPTAQPQLLPPLAPHQRARFLLSLSLPPLTPPLLPLPHLARPSSLYPSPLPPLAQPSLLARPPLTLDSPRLRMQPPLYPPSASLAQPLLIPAQRLPMAQPQLSLPPLAPRLRARLPLSLPQLLLPSLPVQSLLPLLGMARSVEPQVLSCMPPCCPNLRRFCIPCQA